MRRLTLPCTSPAASAAQVIPSTRITVASKAGNRFAMHTSQRYGGGTAAAFREQRGMRAIHIPGRRPLAGENPFPNPHPGIRRHQPAGNAAAGSTFCILYIQIYTQAVSGASPAGNALPYFRARQGTCRRADGCGEGEIERFAFEKGKTRGGGTAPPVRK